MDRPKKYIIIALAICFLIIAIYLFQVSKSRSFQFFGGLTQRQNTDQKVVALTFDDGPLAIYR